jgi:hypothetical protein
MLQCLQHSQNDVLLIFLKKIKLNFNSDKISPKEKKGTEILETKVLIK